MVIEITDVRYFELKSKKLTRAQIADQFGIPDWKLKKIIAKNKWGMKRPIIENMTPFINDDEESYYWAGFIAADGNISDSNDLGFCIHYDDTVMLEKFKLYMKAGHKIYSNTERYNRSELVMRVNKATSDILRTKFNIIPRKSLVYELPSTLNNTLFHHYLRGYFDGDGSICESFSNANSITATLYTNITGSNKFIDSLSAKIRPLLSINGSIQEKTSVKTIKFNTNDSIKLLKYLYNDCTIYLPRKYDLYNKIVVNKIREIR